MRLSNAPDLSDMGVRSRDCLGARALSLPPANPSNTAGIAQDTHPLREGIGNTDRAIFPLPRFSSRRNSHQSSRQTAPASTRNAPASPEARRASETVALGSWRSGKALTPQSGTSAGDAQPNQHWRS